MPANITPNPATASAMAALRPCDISRPSAPSPTSGKASLLMPYLNPTSATSQPVVVVPKLAPMTTPIACEKVRMPALTKPMVARVVALED